LFNKRDYIAAERFWSPNYIQHSAHIPPGREGLFAESGEMLLDREAPHRGPPSAIAILKVRLGVALVIGIDVDPDVENLARRDIPGERVKAGQRIRRRSAAPPALGPCVPGGLQSSADQQKGFHLERGRPHRSGRCSV